MWLEKAIILFTVFCGILWLVFLGLKKIAPHRITQFSDPEQPIWVRGIYQCFGFCRALFWMMVLVVILRSFIAENYLIPSGSMKPSLLEGDFILVTKYHYGLRVPIIGTRLFNNGDLKIPKRGDIIVFRSAELDKNLIKRVVGLPGDYIDYYQGRLLINHKPVLQTVIGRTVDFEVSGQNAWPVLEKQETIGSELAQQYHTYQRQPSLPDAMFKYNHTRVPENCYFVLGDNRDYSKDSRFLGFIRDQDVVGKASWLWFSWDRLAGKMRWTRKFESL